QESAKGARGRSPSAAASPRCGERWGLESIVCPLTKTSASAEEEARRPGPPEPPFLRELTFVSAQNGRPDSSPSGASQLRDSAGFAPDFAASVPAGDMCPAVRAYVITPTAVTAPLTCERWITVVPRITTSSTADRLAGNPAEMRRR